MNNLQKNYEVIVFTEVKKKKKRTESQNHVVKIFFQQLQLVDLNYHEKKHGSVRKYVQSVYLTLYVYQLLQSLCNDTATCIFDYLT